MANQSVLDLTVMRNTHAFGYVFFFSKCDLSGSVLGDRAPVGRRVFETGENAPFGGVIGRVRAAM